MTSIIKLEDVWKIYQIGKVKVYALRGLNLDVRKGEFLSIMGPSGSGKSTLVTNIGCLDLPTKGRILLDSRDISHLSESDLATIRGKKIGFIFQQFNLLNTLTALENVTLPMVFQETTEAERIKSAKELLAKVGLADRMFHRPTELSGGQQQRVAIARALANNPEVILADEPTGNLDSKTGDVVMQFLQELNSQGKTIIMVTHNIDVAGYAHRIAYLKDGRIIKQVIKK